ncbi:MAG: ABC transporter six-transmembrane domain-containing protein [Pseudomonadota bacterium]
MRLQGTLDVGLLLRAFRWKIAITWLLVLLENLLWALIPLFIGRAIDALLARQPGALWELGAVMTALIVVAVGARVYDTRAYGTMRVHFGAELVNRIREEPVSRVNARLDMSREMVDFLEEHVPELLTSIVQVVVSIGILWSYDSRLGMSGICVVVGLAVVYGLFHQRFYRLNAKLNAQTEKQVSILEQRRHEPLLVHLKKLRRREIRLSDTEAVLYGSIFAGMFAFILANLWFATSIEAITAGMIFVILSYTWELVESGAALPAVLQQWTRLSEIRERINAPSA